MQKITKLFAYVIIGFFSATQAMEQAESITITKKLSKREKSNIIPVEPQSLTLPLKALEGSVLLNSIFGSNQYTIDSHLFNQIESIASYLQQSDAINSIIAKRPLIRIIQDLKIADFFGFTKIVDTIIDYFADVIVTPNQLNQFSLTPQLIRECQNHLVPPIISALEKKLFEKIAEPNEALKVILNLMSITVSPSVSIMPHNGKEVRYACYNNDGSRFLTVSENEIKIWDATTKKEIVCFQPHQNSINTAVFSPASPNIILSASNDCTAVLWDTTLNRRIHHFDHGMNSVHTASFSADGQKIITASGFAVRIYDANTNVLVHNLAFEDGADYALFCNNPREIAILSGNKVMLYDTQNQISIHTYKSFLAEGVLAIDTSNSFIAQSNALGTISIYNLQDNSIRNMNTPYEAKTLQFNPNNPNQLLIASDKHYATIYDASNDTERYLLDGHQSNINTAFFKSQIAQNINSQEIITASVDGTIKFWKLFELKDVLKNCNLEQLLFIHHLLLEIRLHRKYTIDLNLPKHQHLKQIYLSLPPEAKKAIDTYIEKKSTKQDCVIS